MTGDALLERAPHEYRRGHGVLGTLRYAPQNLCIALAVRVWYSAGEELCK